MNVMQTFQCTILPTLHKNLFHYAKGFLQRAIENKLQFFIYKCTFHFCST